MQCIFEIHAPADNQINILYIWVAYFVFQLTPAVEGDLFFVLISFLVEMPVSFICSANYGKLALVLDHVEAAAEDANIILEWVSVVAIVVEQASCTNHSDQLFDLKVEEVQFWVRFIY